MKLVLIGGGGHARVVADAARMAGFDLVGVLTPEGASVAPGLARIGDEGWIGSAPADVGFHLAFGPRPGSRERQDLFERLAADGVSLPAVAAAAFISPSAEIGAGSLMVQGATVNAGARIGRNVIVNTCAVIEHDCVVGDHSHVAPGVVLTGGVKVGIGCLIGARAVLLPGITIADRVTIGAGAVVVRSISEPGSIWSGNPARPHPGK
jgi:UDP-perosamine 4-acetyltransferase